MTRVVTPGRIFGLNVLLGIVLLFAILFLVRDVFISKIGNNGGSHSAATQREPDPSPAPGTIMEYAPLVKENPFGVPGGELKLLSSMAGNGVSGEAPGGEIVLVGTVVGPRELSYAVFRDSSGMQELFKIGQSVFGSGRLYKVQRDKAVLRRGSEMVQLALEDVPVREIVKGTEQGSPSDFARRVGHASYVVDQGRLQEMISNPGRMMTDARLKPNVGNGAEGFTVNEIKPGGIYHSLGLQDGDVLLRINEYEISNPERALQAFTALKGMARVQVDLIRSGAKMTMTYQIK